MCTPWRGHRRLPRPHPGSQPASCGPACSCAAFICAAALSRAASGSPRRVCVGGREGGLSAAPVGPHTPPSLPQLLLLLLAPARSCTIFMLSRSRSLSLSIPQKSTVRCCVCNLTLAFLVSLSLSHSHTLSIVTRAAGRSWFISLTPVLLCVFLNLLAACSQCLTSPPPRGGKPSRRKSARPLVPGRGRGPPHLVAAAACFCCCFHSLYNKKKIKHIPSRPVRSPHASTPPLRTARRSRNQYKDKPTPTPHPTPHLHHRCQSRSGGWR